MLAFCALGAIPDTRAIDEWVQPLERCVVLLYDRTSTEEGVNQARKQLFCKKGRTIDGLHRLHSSNKPRELPIRLATFGSK